MSPEQRTLLYNKLLIVYLLGKYTHSEIAKQFNISYQRVQNFYSSNKVIYDIPVPPRKCWQGRNVSLIMKYVEDAYKEYKDGLTLEQIGAKYGDITRERVRQVFLKNGFKTRGMGRIRKYTYCKKGHKLGLTEFFPACKKCRKENKRRKEQGLHLKIWCKKGHALIGQNVAIGKLANGGQTRRCRICMYAKQREWKKRKLNKI